MWLKMMDGGWRNLDTAKHLGVVESATDSWRIMVDGSHVSEQSYVSEDEANEAVGSLIPTSVQAEVKPVKTERKTKK